MTVVSNRQYVACDGDGCTATAPVSVGLNRRLSRPAEPRPSGGWLYVVNRAERKHYCPRCSTRYLSSLREGSLQAERL